MRRFFPLLLLAAALLTAALVVALMDEDPALDRRDRERAAHVTDMERQSPANPSNPSNARDGNRAPKNPRTVAGAVREEGGRPVAGAVVRATAKGAWREVVTGADGRYELAGAPDALAFDVYATGYLPLIGTVNGRSNGALDYVFDGDGPWTRDFVLKRATPLMGRVTDPNGAPVGGARVYVISAEHQVLDGETVGNVVRTDGEGRYAFPGFSIGVTDVGVRADGFLPMLALDVEIPASGPVVRDFVLDRGRTIAVTVLPEDVAARVQAADSRLRTMLLPPGGLELLDGALVGRTFVDHPVVSQTAEKEGRYLLAGVGRAPADVEAVDREVQGVRGIATHITEDGIGRLLDTTEPELTLRLLAATLVVVTVRDAVTGEQLEPTIERVSGGRAFPVSRMIWIPLDERQHALRFTHDGYETTELSLPKLEPNIDPPPHFDVIMYPRIEGDAGVFHVVFEPALEGGRVAVVGRDADGVVQWVRHMDRPGPEGKWTPSPVPVGEFRVTVLATGMIPVTLPRVVVAPGIRDSYTVPLTKGGGLTMRVTDREGKLLDHVYIRLADAADQQIDVHVLTRVSDGRGFVSVNYLPVAATAGGDSGLAPGTYTLAAVREGYRPSAKTFTIVGTETAEVELALERQ